MKFIILIVVAIVVLAATWNHFANGETSLSAPKPTTSSPVVAAALSASPSLSGAVETPVRVLRRYQFKNRPVPEPAILSEFRGDDTELMVDPITNAVVWRGAPDLGIVFAGLDRAGQMVTLECVFVLVRLSQGEDFGVSWVVNPLVPTSLAEVRGVGGFLTADVGSLDLGIRHRSSQGRLDVISRPSVMMVEGEQAEIASGREIATLQTESQLGTVSQGVSFRPVELAVSASFLKLGDYRLNLKFINSDVGRQVELANAQVPELITQRVETAAMMSPGVWYSAGSVVVDNKERSKDSPLGMLLGGSRSNEVLRSEVGLFVRIVDSSVERHQSPSPSTDHPAPLLIEPDSGRLSWWQRIPKPKIPALQWKAGISRPKRPHRR